MFLFHWHMWYLYCAGSEMTWENSCLFILICEKTKSIGSRQENKTIATSAYCFYLFGTLSNLLIYFSHGNTRYSKKDLLYISIWLKRLWKQNNIIHNAAAALFICSTQVFLMLVYSELLLLHTGKETSKNSISIRWRSHRHHAHFCPCLELLTWLGGYFEIWQFKKTTSSGEWIVFSE